MGFLEKFLFVKKPRFEPPQKTIDWQALEQIAQTLSQGDARVMDAIGLCLRDFDAYFNLNRHRFAERGLSHYGQDNIAQVAWLGLADDLVDGGFVVEVGYATPTDEVLFRLEPLAYRRGVERGFAGVYVAPGAGLLRALREVANFFAAQSLFLGYLDINSDSYLLFVAGAGEVRQLIKLAERAEQNISFAL